MKERIVELLKNEYDAIDIITINDKLGLSSVDELRDLQGYLDELADELVVYITKKNRYILYENCKNFKKGKIAVNKKGFGFLLLPDEDDIHIAYDNLNLALDGDTVLVEVTDPSRKEGRVLKVLERDLKNIVGKLEYNGKKLEFIPSKKININLVVESDSFKGHVDGEIVVVTITEDKGNNKYVGRISQTVCHKDDPHEDILRIAANYDIFEEYPEAAMEEARSLPTEVLESEIKTRTDLRDKMIFTIDGADTKDIDDAISYEYENGLHILGVHIADVSHYVKENSALDNEAYTRGNSAYLANSVIPMLPHILSNGICSLNPNEDRLAISCVMKINESGRVVDYDIFESVIRSRKKMTYTDVNKVIEEDIIPEGYEEFAPTLKKMMNLAHIIRKERENRGASDFDIDEIKIICDESGKPIDIKKRSRGEGERMIEDFMIASNETTATAVTVLGLPCIYRVHDVPRPEKLQQFLTFLESIGQHITGKFKEVNPKSYQKLLAQIDVDDSLKMIVRSQAVRTMPKACYSSNNIGHFGLASKCYTHETSPIRRYNDLTFHRLLKRFIINANYDNSYLDTLSSSLEEIAKHISDREVAEVEAEREVNKMKMAEYMEEHVGEVFDGIVSGVQTFGLFIQLDNLIECFVPLNTLDDDIYQYVESLQCLIGKNKSNKYQLGKSVTVRCVRASKEAAQIDFELIKGEENDRNKE